MPPEISACLQPDEKVLWQGRPRPYVFILRGFPSVIYGMTWAVLGAFWYRGAGGIGKDSAFEGWWRLEPLLSIPFIVAGFSFFFYPIQLGARARRTRYVVTNRRVFIVEGAPLLRRDQAPALRVFAPGEMGAPEIRKRFDGLDDVILTRRAQENPHLAPRLDAGFFGLTDSEAAAGAINAAMNP